MKYLSRYDGEREDALARFAVQVEEERLADRAEEKRLADSFEVSGAGDCPPGYELWSFCAETMAASDFYNGAAYLDTMDREATQRFLSLTHERYVEKLGDLFGNGILGIFTDEPHRGALFNGFALANENRADMIPYTPSLFEAYERTWGEDLRARLPELWLFETGREENPTMRKYIEVVERLFLDNFAAPCRDWCRAHNLILTGHVLHEDSLAVQTSLSGSVMRYYEYLDYPGIDLLGEYTDCYWIAKQCSSVARQQGKPFAVSELYGCTGWQMTFEDYKQVGDWQALFGISFRCPHLSWYTMKGEAKRDYPASILHQSGWYRDYALVEGAKLRVGKAVYSEVLLRPGQRVRGSTAELLDKFRLAGGRVVTEISELRPGFRPELPPEIGVCARRIEGDVFVFLLNLDRKNAVSVAGWSPPDGMCAEEFDLRTGRPFREIYPGDSLGFARGQERFLRLFRPLTLPDSFDFELTEPNVLVLERADCRVDGAPFAEDLDVLKLDGKLRDSFGLTRRGGESV